MCSGLETLGSRLHGNTFFRQIKVSHFVQLAFTSWTPSLYHNGCVLGTSTVHLKMWLPGVNSYCCELLRAQEVPCVLIYVCCSVCLVLGEVEMGRGTSHCSKHSLIFS